MVGVRNKQIARSIQSHARGQIQIRLSRWLSVIHHRPGAILAGYDADRSRNQNPQRTLPNAGQVRRPQRVVARVQQHHRPVAWSRILRSEGHRHRATAGADPRAVVRAGLREIQIRRAQSEHFDLRHRSCIHHRHRHGLCRWRGGPYSCCRESRLGLRRSTQKSKSRDGHQRWKYHFRQQSRQSAS